MNTIWLSWVRLPFPGGGGGGGGGGFGVGVGVGVGDEELSRRPRVQAEKQASVNASSTSLKNRVMYLFLWMAWLSDIWMGAAGRVLPKLLDRGRSSLNFYLAEKNCKKARFQ
jgi:hypothetical protein